jgi:uncharacterized membrane protein (DUF4010 family)
MLAGYGHFIETIFLAIIVTIILYSRERLHKIVEHLNQKEVGDLFEFLIILGIIYPIIPQTYDFYGVIIPVFAIWVITVLISLVNFAAFIGARYLKGKQEIELISFAGGLISSTATSASLADMYHTNKGFLKMISAGFLINAAAMLIRNFAIMGAVSTQTAKYLILPGIFGTAILLSAAYLKIAHKRIKGKLHVTSPFNALEAAKLGILIFVLYILLSLAQTVSVEFFLVSIFLSGMMGSSAVMVSLASFMIAGAMTAPLAAIATFTAVIGSLTGNYIICYFKRAPKVATSNTHTLVSAMAITLAIMFGLILIG